MTEVIPLPGPGRLDFVVVTRDTAGLFALIAGRRSPRNGVNILSAQIETRADGVAPTRSTSTIRAAMRSWTRAAGRPSPGTSGREALAGECSVEALRRARGRARRRARPPRRRRARPG